MGHYESKRKREIREKIEKEKEEERKRKLLEERNKEFKLKIISYYVKYGQLIKIMRERGESYLIPWETKTYELNVTLNTTLKEIYDKLEISKGEQRLYLYDKDLTLHNKDEKLYSILNINTVREYEENIKYNYLYLYKEEELYKINLKPNYVDDLYLKVHDTMDFGRIFSMIKKKENELVPLKVNKLKLNILFMSIILK